MEERKKKTRSTRKIRSIIKNITRNIIRRGLNLLIHLTRHRVLMKVKSPIANVIIDQEVETVIIGQDQDLMREGTGEITHVIERIDTILVKEEETPEKEVSRLSPNHPMISDPI
jgi:hypothetical protein